MAELLRGDSKHPFDTLRVQDCNLNVCSLTKPGIRIQWGSFGEYTLQRVDCRESLIRKNRVQTPNHGAVEISPQLILIVRGQRQVRRLGYFDQTPVCNSYPVQSDRCR